MVEMFVMQRYLQPSELRRTGMYNFDAWAANFGEVVSSLELAPEGTGYRLKNRFAKFTNLPELMTMFKKFADIQLPDMLDLPVPTLRNGKIDVISTKPSEYVKHVMEEFAERATAIHENKVDPHIDNMLKVTNEARLLGTDPRLLNPEAYNDENSKVNNCIQKAYEFYIEFAEIKGTQIIFCDVGTPN